MLVTKFAVYFIMVALLAPAQAQDPEVSGGFGRSSAYDGPAILGRGGPNSGKRGKASLPIQIQASLNGTYDTNILGYSVDSSGNFSQQASVGINATLSASGRKEWRRNFLGLDYSGDYNHYIRQTFYNGSNHQLNLAFGTQFGRKVQIITQVGAGTSNRFIGGPAIFQTTEIEFLAAPTQELFDSRSYFGGVTSGVTYSFNNRQSVRLSGNTFTVRRRARGLIDMQSYGASADYVRRVNRVLSVGSSYTFTHFDYSKVFGESEIHTLGGHMSRKFGRDWELAGTLTGSKQSTVGVRSVALDPVLAALLGRGSGLEVFESNNLLYGYSASVTRRIRRSNATISTQRGITPGNGYFLTSINQSTTASIGHSFSRDVSIGASFGYNKLTSLGFASGEFRGWTGGATATYKLNDSFGLNARYDWRTFDLRQTTFGRTGQRVTLGITYFPQRGPAGLF